MKNFTVKKTIAVVLASVLGLCAAASGGGFGTMGSPAAAAGAPVDASDEAMIDNMLAAGDYVDGEAIVVMRGDKEPRGYSRDT